MKQRPQHAIGITNIVFVEILAGQVESGKGEGTVEGDFGHDGGLVDNLSAPPKPDPAALLQRGAQQPALRNPASPPPSVLLDWKPPPSDGWPRRRECYSREPAVIQSAGRFER